MQQREPAQKQDCGSHGEGGQRRFHTEGGYGNSAALHSAKQTRDPAMLPAISPEIAVRPAPANIRLIAGRNPNSGFSKAGVFHFSKDVPYIVRIRRFRPEFPVPPA